MRLTGLGGIEILEGIQPHKVSILRVLDTLSRGSVEGRVIHDSETEVMGCTVVDDNTVDDKFAAFSALACNSNVAWTSDTSCPFKRIETCFS